MANYKEEHIRNNRRLARQIVGGVALLLAVIGLFTVFGWVVSLLRSVLDDSDRRKAYEDRLFGMVMLDPLAFSDVSSVDPGVFKQAAIWGTVYQVQNSGGSLDQYERDPDTGSAIIPKLEIDTYIANLLGPDYTVDDGSFSTDVFSYQYDEEKQGYLVPVTSSVAQYTPEVEKIWKADGKSPDFRNYQSLATWLASVFSTGPMAGRLKTNSANSNPVRRYRIFKKLHQENRLHPGFIKLRPWEMRFVVGSPWDDKSYEWSN